MRTKGGMLAIILIREKVSAAGMGRWREAMTEFGQLQSLASGSHMHLELRLKSIGAPLWEECGAQESHEMGEGVDAEPARHMAN